MTALYYLLKELVGWLDKNGQPTHTPDSQEAVTFTVPSKVLTAIRWYLEHKTILTPPRQSEFITGKQLDGYIRRIVKQNLKEHGHSLSEASLGVRVHYLIEEIRGADVKIRIGWRDALKWESDDDDPD